MTNKYRAITLNGTSVAFVAESNLNHDLKHRVAKSKRVVSATEVDLVRNEWKVNTPYAVSDTSGTKNTPLALGITISGPVIAETQLLAELDELIRVVRASIADKALQGFVTQTTAINAVT